MVPSMFQPNTIHTTGDENVDRPFELRIFLAGREAERQGQCGETMMVCQPQK